MVRLKVLEPMGQECYDEGSMPSAQLIYFSILFVD
jgi:hypothetical protein